MATSPQRIREQLRARLEIAPDDGWVSTKGVLRWFWSSDRDTVRAVLADLVAGGEVERRPVVYRGCPGTRYRLTVQDLSGELAALGLAWPEAAAA